MKGKNILSLPFIWTPEFDKHDKKLPLKKSTLLKLLVQL